MHKYTKFVKDVGIIGAANIALGVRGLVLVPVVIKLMGAFEYGIWTQVNVTSGFALCFAVIGLPYALTRFLPSTEDPNDAREDFYSILTFTFVVNMGVAAALWFFAGDIAALFFDGVTDVVRLTGFIIMFSALDNVCLGLFRALRQMKKYSAFTIVEAYVQVGLIIFLARSGYGIYAIVLSVLIVKAVMFAVLLYNIRSQIGVARPRFTRLRQYLSFGLPTIPGSMSQWALTFGDRYVVVYFLGAAAVGVYSAGYVIGSIPLMAAQVLGFVLTPTIAALYDKGKLDEVRTYLSYSLKYFLMVAIPFIVASFMLERQVLVMLASGEVAVEAHLIVPLIAISSLIAGIYIFVGDILFLAKKMKIVAMIWSIAAVVNVLLNLFFVPRMGILGAAVTTIIAYSLAIGITCHYAFKELTFGVERRFILRSLAASAIMCLLIWRLEPVGTYQLLGTVAAATGVYFGSLILLKGFHKGEFALFKHVLGRKG